MRLFRRVFADQAGPSALGILVPPGKSTTVIVRPRALEWDLLVARMPENETAGVAFLEANRRQAGAVAQELADALENGETSVQPVTAELEVGFWVAAEVKPFTLLACRRAPGQPYRPAMFSGFEEARDAAAAIAAVLCPNPGCEQEVYFNTRNFAR